MVKSILAAICIMGATLAGLYVPGLLLRTAEGENQEVLAKPELFKSDHIAVAIFENGKVVGYFTSRLSGEILDPTLKGSIIARLTHELHKAVYASPETNFRKPQPDAMTTLAEEITNGANARAAKTVIEKLTIEDPDFLRRL
jgi:hypothetical protein